MFWEQQNQRP